jgi:hypothetical protein
VSGTRAGVRVGTVLGLTVVGTTRKGVVAIRTDAAKTLGSAIRSGHSVGQLAPVLDKQDNNKHYNKGN